MGVLPGKERPRSTSSLPLIAPPRPRTLLLPTPSSLTELPRLKPVPSFDPSAPAQPGSGLFGLDCTPDEAAVHVLPVPFDATASYRKGAARGPAAVLRASHQIDLFDRSYAAGSGPYEAGLCLLDEDPRIAAWNAEATPLCNAILERGGEAPSTDGTPGSDELREVNAIGTRLNGAVYDRATAVLEAGKLPVVLGGDHSVPYGAIRACAERHPGLGLLHFDAHADLRVAYCGFTWSHASIMENALRRLDGVSRLVQVGVRDLSEQEHDAIHASQGRIRTLFDDDWATARLGGADLRTAVRKQLAYLPREVYVSCDIDGLEPSLCPNTGTPVPGGLSWSEVRLWLDELVRSGRRVVGMDLVEVNPGPEPEFEAAGRDSRSEDSWDAMVGARLLYRMISAALSTR